MSYQDCPEPIAGDEDPAHLEQIIVPRTSDIGGFEVRRALPSANKRMVGPFVFFDQMGPSEFLIGHGLDVRPHPHIGLATVTYLFEGEITHRDSLGTIQVIRPGAVNLMTAGQGIAHSERTPEELRRQPGQLAGIQAWLALPKDQEECAPDFSHHPAAGLPMMDDAGVAIRLLAGELFGQRAPVPVATETLYADIQLAAGMGLPIDSPHEERALYLVSGTLKVDGHAHEPGRLLALKPGARLTVSAIDDCRFMLLGGEPMDGPRHIWWNFVSSSRDRIEQAKSDWKAGRFDRVIDDNEYIPLPEK